MSDYEVKVTIKDLDIKPKDQKMLQKVKAELEKTLWGAGNVNDTKLTMEFFERPILQQDLHIIFLREDRIIVRCGGSDIDRDNLALIEKVFKTRADIDVDEGRIKLGFDLNKKPDTHYTQFGFFKSMKDIPMNMTVGGKYWDCEIHGYTWKNRKYE